MVRLDQEALSLEAGAEEQRVPDEGLAFSVGRRVVFLGRDEAPAAVAKREDDLVRLLFQEGAADSDGAGVGFEDGEQGLT